MRRDLVVFGEPTLQKALRTVGSLWQAQSIASKTRSGSIAITRS
jgi:hypothetical protein